MTNPRPFEAEARASEAMRRLIEWAGSVWSMLPYDVRKEVNMRDLNHARAVIKEWLKNRGVRSMDEYHKKFYPLTYKEWQRKQDRRRK